MNRIVLSALALSLFTLIHSGPVLAEKSEKEKYVSSVVTLLRLHEQAIRQLSTNSFKYSENLARHAKALQQTFGLLGPMDWHTAKSVTMHRRVKKANRVDAQSFELLAKNSTKTLKSLHLAARQELEEGKKGVVIEALETLQRTCQQCHDLLPEGAAPQVWNLDVPPGE
ncbi:MAG: cytochrome c [Magnetococcales bacterium]|nr:cytochrome c [Magnetococcales bacterium]